MKTGMVLPIVFFASATQGFCGHGGLLDRIKENYSGGVSLSATFEVHISWKVRETQETKRGSIVLAPGDRFRVELGPSLWVSDGKTVWQYDKTINQAVAKPLSAVDDALLPSRAVSRYCSVYPLVRRPGSGRDAVFEWKPDSAGNGKTGDVSFVSMTADTKTAVVKTLRVIDGNGNESTYTFFRTAVGGRTPAGAFEFVPPKGARVLDQR
jgi:outer membrane lipoprotein carrier protein